MPRNEEPSSKLKQKRTERAATRRLAGEKGKIRIHTPFATEVILLYRRGRNQRGKLSSQPFFAAVIGTEPLDSGLASAKDRGKRRFAMDSRINSCMFMLAVVVLSV